MTAAIQAFGLQKTYRGFRTEQRALTGISLTIPSGSAFGLIGPNGAGKTTFIKCCLGIVRPTLGSVLVLGGDPEDPAVRRRLGYLPERLHLPAALRARDFLSSVAALKTVKVTAAALSALLRRVGLEDGPQRIGTFSKGMRQRLGLAAALLGDPQLLILDEPTDGIDPVGRIEIRALLLEERQKGTTLLLNSHLLSETERICDRFGVLARGEVVRSGTLDEVRSARGWQIALDAPVDDAVVLQLGLSRDDAGLRFTGEVEGLNVALDGLRAAGHRLTALTPLRGDLESILVERA